jgi:hypothetical protein
VTIRLVIDRLVLDGVSLSAGERARLIEDVRASLASTLRANAMRPGGIPPAARRVPTERVTLPRQGRGGLGGTLGRALGRHVWSGPDGRSRGTR